MNNLAVGLILLGLAVLVCVAFVLELSDVGLGSAAPPNQQDRIHLLEDDPTVDVSLKTDPSLPFLDPRPLKIDGKIISEDLVPPWERNNVDRQGFYHYTVKPDDTLSGLSRTYLGKATRWRDLQEYNPDLQDPRDLQPGTVLMIPLWLRER